MEKEYNYKMSFKDYHQNSRAYGKFAAVLTKKQFAIETNIYTHEDGTRDLIEKTRPDIEVDAWENPINTNEKYTDSYIVILGYPEYVQIELPQKEMLSPDQFEMLKEEILEPIKEYNNKINDQGYGIKTELVVIGNGIIKIHFENFDNSVDELISILEQFVQEPETIKDEVIIGTPFKETNKLIEDRNQKIEEISKMLKKESEKHSRIRGFSTISIITVITSLIVMGILVLGIILTF